MSSIAIYGVGSALLIAIALHGVIIRRHLIRQILALNVLSGGVFLFLIVVGAWHPDRETDPVPQALVITGIVVAVSTSAFALAIVRAIHARTGRTTLSEVDLE